LNSSSEIEASRGVEARMFDRLVEDFRAFDDFCQLFYPRWEARRLTKGTEPPKKRGPEAGMADSEIMTILVLYHSSNFKNFRAFYEGVATSLPRPFFPGLPCYARFITLTSRVWVPLTFFPLSRMGRKTGIYYIDSTSLPVCHTRRIGRHKVFAGLAARGKTSTGWFFGLKLHLVFNHQREIVALTITPGNVSDTAPLPELTQDPVGKLFGDKGYVGKEMAAALLRRGLALMTRVRRNMKRLPVSFFDKALLNGRNVVETIIGHIKAFSSLRLPKHRSIFNAFTHIVAAITAYQINPLPPKPIHAFIP
jgi:Transposase DDE domain